MLFIVERRVEIRGSAWRALWGGGESEAESGGSWEHALKVSTTHLGSLTTQVTRPK